MKVILKQDVDKLGKAGDVVKVATGYGRNYLIPMKIAVEATPGNLKVTDIERLAAPPRPARQEGASLLAKEIVKLQITIRQEGGRGRPSLWLGHRSGHSRFPQRS